MGKKKKKVSSSSSSSAAAGGGGGAGHQHLSQDEKESIVDDLYDIAQGRFPRASIRSTLAHFDYNSDM